MIYLDNSATTRTLPEAAQAAFQAMTEDFFNPAAAYAFGARAEKRVNEARSIIAHPLRAKRDEIIFTSGGTESNNAAIFGSLKAWHGPKRVITTAVEHPSVYEAVQSLKNNGDVDNMDLPLVTQTDPYIRGDSITAYPYISETASMKYLYCKCVYLKGTELAVLVTPQMDSKIVRILDELDSLADGDFE